MPISSVRTMGVSEMRSVGDGIGVWCAKCGHELILTPTTVFCSPVEPTPGAGPPCPPTCRQCGTESASWDDVAPEHKARWWRAQGAPSDAIQVLVRHRAEGRNNFMPTCLCPREALADYAASDAELALARSWLREHGMSDDWAPALLARAANDPADTVWELPDRTVHLSKAEAIGLLDPAPRRT